jgi:hypothetical protein
MNAKHHQSRKPYEQTPTNRMTDLLARMTGILGRFATTWILLTLACHHAFDAVGIIVIPDF